MKARTVSMMASRSVRSDERNVAPLVLSKKRGNDKDFSKLHFRSIEKYSDSFERNVMNKKPEDRIEGRTYIIILV